ncbi:MAG TPA: CDP-alcohol phosphatidyltransferase family protein [Steroidobacteraceae bacterium]|nr:CDP-alcohol phosphatidyltransferase family protein [Steroidobacteraceae bacterium]
MILRHLPNLICIARIGLVWPTVAALERGNFELAMLLFIVAAVSDGLDGYLAKRFHWTSELGKLLDPAADKLLLVSVFVSATWLGLVPRWLTAAAVARDAMIALGALVFRMWFGPLRGRPTPLSKLNTGMQLAYLLAVMSQAAFHFPSIPALTALAAVTLLTTIASGLDYITAFTRRALALPAGSR